MPSTVLDLLESIPIKLTDSVRWNESVQNNKSGVYIVSLSKDPGKNCGALNSAPIEIKTVEKWSRVGGLELKVSECHQKRKIRKRHGIGNQTKK